MHKVIAVLANYFYNDFIRDLIHQYVTFPFSFLSFCIILLAKRKNRVAGIGPMIALRSITGRRFNILNDLSTWEKDLLLFQLR